MSGVGGRVGIVRVGRVADLDEGNGVRGEGGEHGGHAFLVGGQCGEPVLTAGRRDAAIGHGGVDEPRTPLDGLGVADTLEFGDVRTQLLKHGGLDGNHAVGQPEDDFGGRMGDGGLLYEIHRIVRGSPNAGNGPFSPL